MSRIVLGLSIAAIVATAACNSGGGEDANDSASNQQTNATVANVAAGQGAPPNHKAIMKARHDNYEEMGDAMKGINRELKAGSPDVAAIQRHAALIARYGPQIPTWFPQGSGPEAGRTRAKAEIWSDAATFRSAAQRMEQASASFNAAAQTGNVDAIRGALPALKDSCSNCHDKFRAPERD
ncbi:MAG TPA: cytochrome c [Allosphingosinicella sp.]|nr:cytochrome c [Allosphingosinicella sp.]